MIPIIDPVDRTLILKELTADKLLRKTNNGGNEIYVVTARNSPNIMQELGRLRELSFRDAGGGTGAAVDTLYSMQTVSRADFDAGETYLTLMERNYEALRKGLNE